MRIFKNVFFVVIILSLFSKGLGFYRDILITNYFGFGITTDALLMAISIVTLLFSFFQTSIRTTFVPIFSQSYRINQEKAVTDFNSLKSFILIILIILTGFLYLNANRVAVIFAPGFDQEAISMTTEYFHLSLILLLTYGVFYINTGFLQAIRIFSTLETAGIVNNVVIIVILFSFSQQFGPISVIFGYIIGSLFQVFISYYTLNIRTSYTFKFTLKIIKSPIIKNFINLSKYVMVGSLVTQVSVFLDKFIASYLITGSVTALHYANLLKTLPLTIVVLTVTNIFFPNLTVSYKEDKITFTRLIEKQLIYMSFFTLYVSVIFICLSKEIVTLLFYRGEFTMTGIEMVSSALIAYSCGSVFWVIKEVLGKVSYAVEDTKTPMILAINSLIINLVLNILLSYYFGHVGIALATSISFAINCLLLYYSLKKNINFKIKKKTINLIISMTIVSMLVIISILYLKQLILEFSTNQIIVITTITLVISIIYITIGKFLGLIKFSWGR
ncbi:murein biosynthesis integral membrane protein MurJ [Bacillus sp. F19]|nr:murein biosynthesis integral membrane protein MurJ [Bacillus sp. F19]